MDTVSVFFANIGEDILSIDVISKWKPSKLEYVGDTVFFKQGDAYFSMRVMDFRKIFNSVK